MPGKSANQFAHGPLDYITGWQRDFAAADPGDPGIPFAQVFHSDVLGEVEPLIKRSANVAHPVTTGLTRQCVQLLSDVSAQPLQHLFSAARENGQSIADFIAFVRDNKLSAEFAEFPELESVLKTVRSTWLEALAEFLQRYQRDRGQLEETFGISPSDTIIDLESGLSDRHHGGRSVFRVAFEDGHQLIYKPREMGLESSWQTLLRWINETGCQPPFRVLRVVDCQGYGWVECCRPQSPSNARQRQQYWKSAGALAALSWTLDAIDIHMGNLMACGSSPVLIDVETLFQTAACSRGKSPPGIAQMGIFPRWQQVADCQIDLSGLGGCGNQLTPCRVPRWVQTGSDDMNVEYVPAVLKPSANATFAGQTHEDETAHLQSGYRKMMQLLRSHKHVLLSSPGPLDGLFEQPVRIVRQSTRDYYGALNVSLQLASLRMNGGRARVIQELLKIDAEAPEMKALCRLDIPRFTQTDPEGFRREVALRLSSIDERLVARHCRDIAEAMANAGAN